MCPCGSIRLASLDSSSTAPGEITAIVHRAQYMVERGPDLAILTSPSGLKLV